MLSKTASEIDDQSKIFDWKVLNKHKESLHLVKPILFVFFLIFKIVIKAIIIKALRYFL